MKVLETKGITLPAAPLVWKAIAYAREMAPLRRDFSRLKGRATQATAVQKGQQPHWERHQYDHILHEHAVEALVCEWLTVRGSDDVSIILTFIDQMYELKKVFSASPLGEHIGLDAADLSDWVILQGQSVFEAVLATPEFADILIEYSFYKSNLLGLFDCLLRLQSQDWEIDTFLGHWCRIKEEGALPADFEGRTLNEVVEEWVEAGGMVEVD